MILTDFPRDLLMTGAIFGVAAFVWTGWAQERPPQQRVWRVVLGILTVCGAALAGITIPAVTGNWDQPTALSFDGPAFTWYIIIFWLEVLAVIALVVLARRRNRSDLFAPLILAVVGIHFIPLAWLFQQPVYAVTGILLTAAAVAATVVPDRTAARSFWCGLLGGGTLLVVGWICAAAGFGAL